MSEIFGIEAHHILEIGSGKESIALQIEDVFFELNSIDISDEAISFAQCNTRLKNASFLIADAHDTQFPASKFDLVIGRGILHHLELPVACAEIKRVLQPEGKVIFGEPLDCNVLINVYRKLTPKIRSRDERPLSREDLSLLYHHFGSLRVRYYGFLTLGPALLGFRSPKFLHLVDDLLLNKLGLGRFLAWACIISSPKEKKY